MVGLIVDVGGFNALRFAGGEGPLYDYPLSAKAVSGAAATITAWLGNRYWTFRHTRRSAAHHEFLLFALVATLGTGISMGCLWFSHYLLGLTSPLADNIAANGFGLALATLFRFWAYRRHVFSESKPSEVLNAIHSHNASPLQREDSSAGSPDAASRYPHPQR
jgi:putative flippase GtrA